MRSLATCAVLSLVTCGAAAILSCSSSTASQARPTSSLLARDAESDRIRATERARLRALVEAKLEDARSVHADDFQLINPFGGTLTKDQYLGAIASGQVDYLFWEADSIAVRVYGDASVIRYQSQLEIVVQGRHIPRARYWHTDAYERRDGRWQVVWSQATAIQ